jgi:WS/DGAT/MGAT family acyltransferase
MTSLDASFLYLEQPNALLHVAGLYTFARPLDYNGLLRYVEERLPLIPRYTQRAVMVPLNLGHPFWEQDTAFDIRHHVVRHRLRGDGERALSHLSAELFAEPLDRNRPLWEMHLIEGFGRGCAVLAKTHHCMIDGASGVQLMNLLMDPTPHPAKLELPTPIVASDPGSTSPFGQAVDGLVDSVRSQLQIGRNLVVALRRPSKAIEQVRATLDAVGTLVRTLVSSAPPTPFNGQIGTRRTQAWARLSLNEVKAIKNRLGGTVNDVVLAIISGGLRHYLRRHGHNVDRTELLAMVPVNVRQEHEQVKLGNRVSMMIAPLPVGITDPLERLRQVSAAMDLLKSSGQAGQMERVVALTDLLPPVLQRPLAQLQASVAPVNTVCTNVPGPRETRYMLGEPVELMVPLVPLAAGIGLGFAILSYADQLTIGVNADAERVPNAWDLAADLHRSFDELWAETGLERVTPQPKAPHATPRRRKASAKSPPQASSAVSPARASGE